MSDRPLPRVNKIPYLVTDLVLLALAGWIVWQQPHPLGPWPLALVVLSVAGACVLALVPFRLEYEAQVKLAETGGLTTAVAEINRLEGIAEQVRLATGQWQGVQEHSGKVVTAAREVADRITAEAKDFSVFLQKANDAERGHLRLEVEKLRRAEGEWLQVLVRILDHVFALHTAARRSNQRNVAEQLTRFQQACREAARRIGLIVFEAGPEEPFEAARHQLPDPDATVPAGAVVVETLACGLSYQGQLLRRAVVRLAGAAEPGEPAPGPASAAAAPARPPSAPASGQKELLLQPEAGSGSELPATGGA